MEPEGSLPYSQGLAPNYNMASLSVLYMVHVVGMVCYLTRI